MSNQRIGLLAILIAAIVLISLNIYRATLNQVQNNTIVVTSSKDTTIGTSRIFFLDGGSYDVPTVVIVTKDVEEALAYVRYYTDSTFTLSDFDGAQAITATGSGIPTIWLSEIGMTLDNITTQNHELYHLTSYMMMRLGIEHVEDTDEAYAYQFDYLTKQFYKHLIKQ